MTRPYSAASKRKMVERLTGQSTIMLGKFVTVFEPIAMSTALVLDIVSQFWTEYDHQNGG